jgi:hypothetical protein
MNLHFKGGVYDPNETSEASAVQRSELWNRWKAGQSLHEIGRVLGNDHMVIRIILPPFAIGELLLAWSFGVASSRWEPLTVSRSGFQWISAAASNRKGDEDRDR